MKNTSTNKQSGAVSLFVVIFFMLLVTVITVSFVRLMVADQRQSSDNDLAQSAYDSAQAGVEDAKRALLQYQQGCSTSPGTCAAEALKLVNTECNAGLNAFLKQVAPDASGKTPEIKVQQTQASTGNDAALLQAYTCVTVKLVTDDYVGNLTANQSQVVPLVAETGKSFDRVKIEWFSRDDIASSSSDVNLETFAVNKTLPLYTQGSLWPASRPSLMRTQLMQVPKNFKLSDFDTVKVSGTKTTSNSATMFLYPTNATSVGEKSFTDVDQRRSSPTTDPIAGKWDTTPLAASCNKTLGSGGFACSAVLVLPQPVDAASNADRTAFLRLQALYNPSHFRVTLLNSAALTPVKFQDVQPSIDSTGRANDMFKRVESRVDLYDTTFPYPDAAIDVTGNFCKDFSVTDTLYIAGSSCTP